MVRETFHHAAIYSGATILGRTISFIMLPFYAHILRDIGYGVIGMIDASLVFLASLLGYNFQAGITRIYHEQTDPEQKRKVVSTGITIAGGLSFGIVLIAGLFSVPLSRLLLGTPEYWHLICLALASFFFDIVARTANTILTIERRSKTYSSLSLLRLILGISSSILFVVVLRWDLLGYFVASFVTALIAGAVSLAVSGRMVGIGFDRKLARDLLGYQLPLIPGSMAQFVSRQIERVLVRFQIGIDTLGVLEMAYKFPVLLNLLIANPFMSSWNTKRTEIADQPGAPERIGRMFTYSMFLLLFGGLLMAVNIQAVLELLTPPEFWEAGRIARIEIVTTIVLAAYVHLHFGLYYAKKTGLLARIRMVTSALKVAVSYTAISLWGLYGAAYSALVTASVLLVWSFVVSQRYYRLVLEWSKLAAMVGASVALFLALNAIDMEVVVRWASPAAGAANGALDSLGNTWLGTWKDGKVITMLAESGEKVLEIGVKSILSLSFLLMMPLVHHETGERVARRTRTLLGRRGKS
ncbi:MAG: lipopolysaccharide biosynthesis protein [Candidatus Krumholzibacteriia bacterium]